jgi:hypothetical protein
LLVFRCCVVVVWLVGVVVFLERGGGGILDVLELDFFRKFKNFTSCRKQCSICMWFVMS